MIVFSKEPDWEREVKSFRKREKNKNTYNGRRCRVKSLELIEKGREIRSRERTNKSHVWCKELKRSRIKDSESNLRQFL